MGSRICLGNGECEREVEEGLFEDERGSSGGTDGKRKYKPARGEDE